MENFNELLHPADKTGDYVYRLSQMASFQKVFT